MKYIQIASYPKSGNTWVSQIISDLFGLDVGQGVLGLHGNVSIKDAMPIEIRGEDICFVKHHARLQNQHVPISGVIYMYRHPLAVFVSSLNYMGIRNRTDAFINGVVKSVDQIVRDGEMDFYFDRFMQMGGWEFYRFDKQTGTWFDHFNYWQSVSRSMDSFYALQYEKMLVNPLDEFLQVVTELLGKSESELRSALILADENTQVDGKFFWKRKAETYREYLLEEQISSFENKYRDTLMRMGY